MSGPEWRRRLGYLANDAGWWSDTVGEHFVSRDEATSIVESLGLSAGALDWPVSRASTGELQRLTLARVMARSPDFALLDEPTSNLDTDTARKVEGLLKDWAGRGAGILVVTHDPEQARRLGGRGMVIADGSVSGQTQAEVHTEASDSGEATSAHSSGREAE